MFQRRRPTAGNGLNRGIAAVLSSHWHYYVLQALLVLGRLGRLETRALVRSPCNFQGYSAATAGTPGRLRLTSVCCRGFHSRSRNRRPKPNGRVARIVEGE